MNPKNNRHSLFKPPYLTGAMNLGNNTLIQDECIKKITSIAFNN